ncbi:hypothetical protein GCM10007897_44980 [Sphingobium jiangsuense]|uniref:Uncharacterized protein n=2 Tax=Sphingobium jiangsuense TaxID=870476 RepID=A0A7W6BSG5_9SPHN|nr:hypothetical protein [Sphingobium jiangsuense]GLT03055.1 hypothetical protein GCM10007897_44980 [Sphingobium jiangsuense]
MTPDLIEKMARAISYRDIGLHWDDCAEEWKDIYRAKATAALTVALEEIGEECAQVADDFAIEAGGMLENAVGCISRAAVQGNVSASKYVAGVIRARIAKMKCALPLTK